MKLWPFGKKKEPVPMETPSNEPAVPTHLKPFFVQWADKGNDTQLTGDIRCSCGCEVFAARQSKDDNCLYHLTCDACRKDLLLFDARAHGWDAMVCKMPAEHLQRGDIAAKCEKCGSERFGVTVWIEPAEKAEFVACVEGELPDSDWVNAFTWFAAHLTCTGCGCRQRDWADIETA